MVFDKVKELIVDQLDVEEDAVKTESVIIDDLGLIRLTSLIWLCQSRKNLILKFLTKRLKVSRLLAIL